eukprot:3322378-Pyramimonas_sp.AAC.1
MLSIFSCNSGCRRATELIRAVADAKSLCASVCCIQRSEQGLPLGLGPQNYSHSSSYLGRFCPFSALNSGSRRATSWYAQETIQKYQG